jgi:hypothetical protein
MFYCCCSSTRHRKKEREREKKIYSDPTGKKFTINKLSGFGFYALLLPTAFKYDYQAINWCLIVDCLKHTKIELKKRCTQRTEREE